MLLLLVKICKTLCILNILGSVRFGFFYLLFMFGSVRFGLLSNQRFKIGSVRFVQARFGQKNRFGSVGPHGLSWELLFSTKHLKSSINLLGQKMPFDVTDVGKMLMTMTTGVNCTIKIFYKQLLSARIPKAQKKTVKSSSFLRFWDLRA